jgi:hypothetical protein
VIPETLSDISLRVKKGGVMKICDLLDLLVLVGKLLFSITRDKECPPRQRRALRYFLTEVIEPLLELV